MEATIKYRSWSYAWGLLLLLIFLYCSWPADFYFANDDFVHIPLSGHRVFEQTHLLRPVSEFTLWFDYNKWGQNAFGYHLTNIIIHLLNVTLVYWFSLLLFKKYGKETAAHTLLKSFAAAIFFLVYPFHVEAVYWILGRGAALACMFTLLALIFYLKRDEQFYYTILSLIFFLTGLFVYETTFVLPLMITLLHYFGVKRKINNKRYFNTLLWYWVAFGAFLAMRYFYAGSNIGLYEAGNILGKNFTLLFYNLNTLVARTLFPPLHSGKAFLAMYIAAVLLGLALLVYLFKRKKEVLSFLMLAVMLYGISLLTVISLGIDTHDTESDRFLYLPSCFFVIAVAETVMLLFYKPGKQLFALSIVSVYFVMYLVVFSKQYQQASYITRQSIEYIATEKNTYRHLYVINLPSQYKGAFIFRSGFKNALEWMCPDLSFENIEILNTKEIVKPIKKLTIAEISYASWKTQNQLPNAIESDRVKQGFLSDREFITGQDLLLEWTDSTITKIK